MSIKLSIILIAFSLIWVITIARLVKKNKLSVKYSVIWFLAAIVIFLVGACPFFISFLCELFGLITVSNFVIGILITLLLIMTLLLTVIITYQKKQIIQLIQEVSLLKKK